MSVEDKYRHDPNDIFTVDQHISEAFFEGKKYGKKWRQIQYLWIIVALMAIFSFLWYIETNRYSKFSDKLIIDKRTGNLYSVTKMYKP